MAAGTPITVLIPDHGEPLAGFLGRIEGDGQLLIIFAELERILSTDEEALKRALTQIGKQSGRIRIATRNKVLAREARAKGIRVIDRQPDLQRLLKGHPQALEAEREFTPHLWRQQLRSRLQMMGLLSLPRLRIWILIILSAGLFFFVFFRLLPSVTVKVWPREDTVSQTVNIFLAQSGSVAALPSRVRVMELQPITVTLDRTITFDQISKEFSGEASKITMNVINNADEPYWLRKGSRLQNQAGMVFRIQDSVQVDPGQKASVVALADPLDVYGDIVGSRGNIPIGVRFDFPALSPDERQVVYAENITAGTGGITNFRTVLQEEDLVIAKKQLEQELLSLAKQLVDERRDLYNAEHDDSNMDILYYEELTKMSYYNFSLPQEFIGQPVTSVPVQGSISYTAYAYDSKAVLKILSREIMSHVNPGRRVLSDTLTLDRLVAHVIDYEDDLSWIKLTIDLSGTEQHILDPLSPTGAVFGKKVREHIKGLSKEEALRVVGNFPEVKNAEIIVWPPWSRTLPSILSHIVVEPVTDR